MLMACCLIGGLATAFAPTPLLAQSVSGEITGSVTDPTGAAIANAQVVATHVVTGVTTTAITNSSGLYTFSELPSGTYDVTVTSSGFSTSVLKGVLVELNHVVSENIEMKPASASTNVEVVADAGVTVDTVSSQLQTTYDTKEVTDLPLAASGLGVLNLSLLSPGVGSSGGTGIGTGPAIGGQRPQNNDFTLEGVDDNDKTVSGPMVLVNPDSVAEFSLLTNVYSAEFGHSDAGHFNTVVRTGTNKFHGRVYEYFQNRNMNAVDTFDAIGNAPGTTKNPRFDNNLFGGGVGGPIIKDKLFFYADYERNPVGQTGGTDQLCVPTAAGVATLGTIPGISATNLSILTKYAPVATAYPSINCGTDVNNNLITSINVGPSGTPVQVGGYTLIAGSFLNKDFLTTAVDYHLSDRDQFRFRYIYNLDDGPDTAAAIPVFWGTAPIRDHLASISYFHTFTPSLLNEARLGYLRNFSKLDAPFPAEFPGLGTFPNLQLNDLNFLQIGPDPNAPSGGIQNTYQLSDNVIWTKGKHAFKFGFDGRKYISPQFFTQRVRGDYEYTTTDLYLQDGVPDYLGERDATATGAIPTDYGDATAFSGFVEDDWHALPKLTLNVGLRYEFQSIPWTTKQQALNISASVPGLITFSEPKPQYKNFGPHFGFAFAPDEKTSIRGGFAIGYDQIRDNLAENTAPPDIAITEDVNSGTPTPFLASGGLAAKAPPLTTPAARRAVTASYSPDQHVPYAENWSLGIQRAFFDKYTFEVRYLGNHAVHLVTQDRINTQPVVTQSFNLPTFLTAPSAGTLSSFGLTLDQMETVEGNGGNFLPAYLNAGFGANIVAYDSHGMSNYNGLQSQLLRRFNHGLLLDLSYTWSKTMDNSTDDVFATYLTPRRSQNSQNFTADYSRSALDHTHRLTFAAVYDLPFFKTGSFLSRNLLGNWEVSPIYTYESPEYATVQSGDDANMNGDSAGDRVIINKAGVKGTASTVSPVYDPSRLARCPVVVAPANPNCDANTIGYSADNPNAYFIQAAPGALTNSGRNTLPGNPIDNFDLMALKRISFHDHYSVEFQAQAFNALNHPQWVAGATNNVGPSLTATNASVQGYVTTGGSDFNTPSQAFSSHPRALQLALKFIF
jgi:hypothetical protein